MAPLKLKLQSSTGASAVRRTPRSARKPVTTGARPAVAKASAVVSTPYPDMLGMTDFSRSLREAVERCSRDQVEVLFSTSSKSPHIRLRPAALYSDVVDELPEENCITCGGMRGHSHEYRALVMVGVVFLVTVGKLKAIMDLHPDCPREIIEMHMKAWRAEVRAGAHASTRKHARRAADASEKALIFLERIAEEQEARDLKRARREKELLKAISDNAGLLARVLDADVISPDDRKLLEQGTLNPAKMKMLDLLIRTKREEMIAATPYGARRPTEADLDIHEVD